MSKLIELTDYERKQFIKDMIERTEKKARFRDKYNVVVDKLGDSELKELYQMFTA